MISIPVNAQKQGLSVYDLNNTREALGGNEC
jgi:hypothetical protein